MTQRLGLRADVLVNRVGNVSFHTAILYFGTPSKPHDCIVGNLESEPHALRQKQVSGQLRENADLDLVLDVLYAPLYYRFLVKNEPPSQKYAEAVVELLINALAG